MALARNSLLNLMPTVAGVAVSILTVPFYLSIVGTERYGALLLAFVLLGYFGQVDFGLGRALTQRLSSMPDALPSERASVVWSALAGASVISVIGGAVVLVAADLFFRFYFDAAADLKAEVLTSVWLFALCVPVIMFTGVSSGALVGLERFGVVSVGTIIGNILSQVLPLVTALYLSDEFSWLLAASIAGRVIGLLPIMASMALVFLCDQPVNPTSAQLRRLFSFGSWIMVTAIIGPLMTMADRLVIGGVFGAAAVVAYSVPVQIASRTVMFPMAIVQALFPRLASNAERDSVALGKVAVVLVGQLFAFVVVGLICLAAPLLDLWLGGDLDPRSVLVGQITLIGIWINALANVPYALIQARGNPRFTAVLHIIELPIYFALLYGFGAAFGLYGVALAFTVRVVLDCAALFQKAEFLVSSVLGRLAGPGAVILAAFATSLLIQDWMHAIMAAALYCTLLIALAWFQMPIEAKNWLTERLRA